MKNFTDQIKKHALEDSPNEACGLIFRVNDVFTARPYPNSHQPEKTRTTAFQIAETAFSTALKSGMLVGFYHSHTNDFEEFGPTDKAMSEELQLPSYLYLVPSDRFKVYYPEGKKPDLVGRPYIPGLYDCLNTIRDFFKEKFGIDSPPPPEYSDEDLKTGMKTGTSEYFLGMGCKPVSVVRPYDIVLMMIRCHGFPNHVGVITEERELFHHLYGRLSESVPYGGMWEKCTSLVFRHPNFLK